MDGFRMDEGDLEPEHSLSRLGVDQLGAGVREPCERGVDVGHLVRDVVHARPALREEPADRRVVAECGQELDAALADPDRRGLDALLLDAGTLLEPAAEQPLVRPHGLVQVDDGNSDVMDPARLHGFDASRSVRETARVRIAAVTGLVVAAALLAGCGGGSSSNGMASKTPNQILAAAEAAALQASAVHIAGLILEGSTPLTLDLRLVVAKGATGSMSENGVGFRVVRIGDKVYIRGSDAFYKQFAGAATARLLKGKWLVSSASTGKFAALTPLTDQQKFFKGSLGSHGTLTKGAETTVNGQKVIALTDGRGGGTLYIATTGQPYPIELVSPGNGKQGKVTFDQWNNTVTITAPKGAVDISKLTG